MKDYFKVIKKNRELNEMLLQWFDETIIHQQKQKKTPLDHEFKLSNNYIEARHAQVYLHTILKPCVTLFLWIAKEPSIEGLRAGTIRLIRESLFLINHSFRESLETTRIFMDILKRDPYEALQRMNRYGVLARYLIASQQ